MLSIQNKFILKCILFFSIFALCIAYFVQYILGHQPCNLCVIERIPYFSAVVLITFILTLKKYEQIISLVITLFFVFGIMISFYHVGIEQGVFDESFVCELVGAKSNNITTDELLKELEKNAVSCKDVTFTILGFSLATFNTIISLILSAIMIINIKKYGKNK
jgi:disulfide bond formation protein DsbB